jgi:hypothetical protein
MFTMCRKALGTLFGTLMQLTIITFVEFLGARARGRGIESIFGVTGQTFDIYNRDAPTIPTTGTRYGGEFGVGSGALRKPDRGNLMGYGEAGAIIGQGR